MRIWKFETKAPEDFGKGFPGSGTSARKSQDDGSLLYETTIPPNTTAELTLPKTSPWSQGDTATETKYLTSGGHRFIVK